MLKETGSLSERRGPASDLGNGVLARADGLGELADRCGGLGYGCRRSVVVMTPWLRGLTVAVLVMALIVGALWGIDRAQAIGQRQRIAEQQQAASATMTVYAAQQQRYEATMTVLRQAATATVQARQNAVSTQVEETFIASMADATARAGSYAATSAAWQTRAVATGTALARR